MRRHLANARRAPDYLLILALLGAATAVSQVAQADNRAQAGAATAPKAHMVDAGTASARGLRTPMRRIARLR